MSEDDEQKKQLQHDSQVFLNSVKNINALILSIAESCVTGVRGLTAIRMSETLDEAKHIAKETVKEMGSLP